MKDFGKEVNLKSYDTKTIWNIYFLFI